MKSKLQSQAPLYEGDELLLDLNINSPKSLVSMLPGSV